jgi:hypothetical protein
MGGTGMVWGDRVRTNPFNKFSTGLRTRETYTGIFTLLMDERNVLILP